MAIRPLALWRLEPFIGVPLVMVGLVGLTCPLRVEAVVPLQSKDGMMLPNDGDIPRPFEEAIAQTPPSSLRQPSTEDLQLDPAVIESSPVLQRWLEEVPDVLETIRQDPAFRTRVRLGYAHFPDQDDSEGLAVGLEDLFIGRTGLTVSADYQATVEGAYEAYGADLRYYVLPLGSYVNVAPILGYRHLTLADDTTEGVNVGARVMLALSRTGAADLSLTQTWTAPGQAEEVGTTTLSLGYAIAPRWRISTDLQRQGSRQGEDARFGLGVEWLP